MVKTTSPRAAQNLLPTPPSLPSSILNDQKLLSLTKDIVVNFVERLDYTPPDAITRPRTTYPALCSEFAAYNDGGEWFKKLTIESCTMAELSYPDLPYEIQLQIARYTWFLIYVDDLGQKFPAALEGFQQCVFENKPPAGGFLEAFRLHLTDMYKYWDKIPANCINLSAMDYINGCLLEDMPSIRNMKLSQHAHTYPFFLRNKTGTALAYAWMMFPKEFHPDMSEYIQVIDDLNLYIDFVNDIMSFYKECIAGETNNYISVRAKITQKSLVEALQDTVSDTLAAYERISKVLRNTNAYVPWKNFVRGYLAFHFGLKRYRLNDLGF